MTNTNGKYPPSVTACRLYERISAKGNKYFSGRWSAMRVTLLPSRDTDDTGQPIWELRLAQAPPSQSSGAPGAFARQAKAPTCQRSSATLSRRFRANRASLSTAPAMKKLRNPSPAAYHEAGHAVAAQRLGWRVLTVSAFDTPRLQHGKWVGGKVSILTPASWFRVPRYLRETVEWAWRRQHLVIIAAGELAQRAAYPRSRDGAGDDRLTSRCLLGLTCSDTRSATALDRHVRAEAATLVRMHWSQIEAIAARLSADETLNRRAFRLAYDAADPNVVLRSKHAPQSAQGMVP